MKAAEDLMGQSVKFWTAFWTGMASPVTLFSAPTPSYAPYAHALSPAQSFSIVGGYLTAAAQRIADERSENDSNAPA